MGRARDVQHAEGLRQASRLWQNDNPKFRGALLFPPFSCGFSAVSPLIEWQQVTNVPEYTNNSFNLALPLGKDGQRFFRLRAP